MIDVIVICNESNCNQCFILCTFQIIIHNVLTDQKVHWTKVQSFHPALCTSINLLYEVATFFVLLSEGVISTLFKIVKNDALNLTFGCDPRPWYIKTLLCLVQFCSKLLDCFSVAKWNAVSLNMKKKNYIEIASASESLVYYLKPQCLGQNIKWM